MKLKQRLKSFFSRPLCLGRRRNKEEIEVSPNSHHIFPLRKLGLARKDIAIHVALRQTNMKTQMVKLMIEVETVRGYVYSGSSSKNTSPTVATSKPYLID